MFNILLQMYDKVEQLGLSLSFNRKANLFLVYDSLKELYYNRSLIDEKALVYFNKNILKE